MSRRAQLVLLCEDQQHEAFLRRFFKKTGWNPRKFRVVSSPPGEGSAEQFVRKNFPEELRAYRRHRDRVGSRLVVMLDGDAGGVDARVTALDEACRNAGVETRRQEDNVAILVPTWCIDTWLAYLHGEDVDETRRNYPRLARPRECQPHVEELASMCHERRLRAPAPQSLEAACEEYRARILLA